MSETITQTTTTEEQVPQAAAQDATVPAAPEQPQTGAPAQDAPPAESADDKADAKAEKAQEREQTKLIQKAVAAFRKGAKSLLCSRVEAGRWCAEFFQWRAAHGFKDRAFSARLLFNALAVHADSERESDPNELAKLYHTVQLLAPRAADGAPDDCWKDSGLTVGKLQALSSLIFRANETETYAVLIREKESDARALFLLACEEWDNRIGKDELTGRVLSITNPEKAKEREERKAEKGKGKPAPAENAAKLANGNATAPQGATDGPQSASGPSEAPQGASKPQNAADGKNPADKRGEVTGNLLNPATAYSSKDAAELCAGILSKSDKPDDALEALLKAVAQHKDFSKRAHRAAQAALIVLTRKDGPSPVQAAAALAAQDGAPETTNSKPQAVSA
jgi:hypothetical protein